MLGVISGYLTFGFILCFGVTFYMMYKYANVDVQLDAKLTVLLGWSFSYCMVFLLPLELSSTSAGVRDQLYPVFALIYWTSFFVTWTIIPFQQNLYLSGYFTLRDRSVDSLKANGKFYLIAAVFYIILLVYVAALKSLSPGSIPGLAMGLANLWGLLLSILLLGYGLVEVPRKIWRSSDSSIRMDYLLYKTASVHEQLADARDQLDETLALFKKADQKGRSKFLRELEIIRRSLPESELTRQVGRDNVSDDNLYESLNNSVELSTLANIHARVKFEVFDIQRLKRCYVATTRKAFHQQQEVATVDRISSYRNVCISIKNLLLKMVSVLLAIFSVLLIWSEVMLAFSPRLSPFNAISEFYGPATTSVLLGFLGFCYMTYCAIFALFRLKLSVFYNMHPNQGTDANSLLFNASYSLRLIFPLGYNFLQIYDNANSTETSLGRLLGPMDDVKILHSANSILPILILVLTLATTANFYNRMLRKFGFSTFVYSGKNDEETALKIKEGNLLLKKAERDGSLRGVSNGNRTTLLDRLLSMGPSILQRGEQLNDIRNLENLVMDDKKEKRSYNFSSVNDL